MLRYYLSTALENVTALYCGVPMHTENGLHDAFEVFTKAVQCLL